MQDTIFGYSWNEISSAQQGGRLGRAVQHEALPTASAEDMALLAQYGSIEAVNSAGLHGVADRLKNSR